MYIEIHHNTSEPLTDSDRAVLQALLGDSSTPAPAPAKKAAAPAPAKKAAAPAPEPEPEEAQEDEETQEESGVTLDDAKELATKMVANGEAAKVKAALTAVGAKKVSEIPEAKVAEFVAALG